MTFEVARTNNPYVPSELWHLILCLHPDLVHLWCSCRQVSRGFRSIVDHIFKTEHLAQTAIEFDLGWDYLDQEGLTDKCVFGVRCTFDRFSDNDKEIAVFKDQQPKAERHAEWVQRHKKMELWKWKEKVDWYTGGDDKGAVTDGGRLFDLSPWVVTVYAMVNDTALPGWNIDYEAREISFRWKEMFQCFFREQEYMDKKTLQFVSL